MLSVKVILILIATVLFLLDGFNVPASVKWFSLGMAAFVASFIF